MFTKKDIADQLKKLRLLEIAMRTGYKSMANAIKDPKYKACFQKLAQEEKEHEMEFNMLLKILEKWGK